jgi:hypothetical protein
MNSYLVTAGPDNHDNTLSLLNTWSVKVANLGLSSIMTSLELNLDEYFEETNGTYNASCHQCRNNKEYQIMEDFLQSDSSMSLQAAEESLLRHCSSGRIVSIIHLCANVVPWHHKSQLKLAYLSERVRWSKRMSQNLDKIEVSSVIVEHDHCCPC